MRCSEYSLKKYENRKTASSLMGSSVVELSQCEIKNVSGGVLPMFRGTSQQAQLSRQVFVMVTAGAILSASAPFPWVPLVILAASVAIPSYASTLGSMKTATVVAEKVNGAIIAAIGYYIYNNHFRSNGSEGSS